jgi:hypothetical protein
MKTWQVYYYDNDSQKHVVKTGLYQQAVTFCQQNFRNGYYEFCNLQYESI